MAWLKHSHTLVAAPWTGFVAAPGAGIELIMDQTALILKAYSQVPLRLKPEQRLWQLLTEECAQALSHSLDTWRGNTLDVCFLTSQGPKHARVWVTGCANVWQLTGVWVDDLIAALDQEQFQRKVLSAVARSALTIRQAPSACFAHVVSQQLALLAERLGAKDMALAIGEPPWRWYVSAGSQQGFEMALHSRLKAEIEDLDASALMPLQSAGQKVWAMAYPHPKSPQTWLLMEGGQTSLLSDEHWPLLSAQLALAVLDRQKELDRAEDLAPHFPFYRDAKGYRALVEESAAIFCCYTADLSLGFANQTLATLLQVDLDTLAGANIAQWLSEEQQTGFVERIAQMSPEHPLLSSEVCFNVPASEPVWWIWVERALFNEQGQLLEIQAVGCENTEVRKTQQQVMQSTKMTPLAEVATSIAHELSQPLHVMSMAIANVLKRAELNNLEPDYLADKLSRINAQIKRATRLVDHVRILGRRAALQTYPFDPQTCVYDAAVLLDQSLQAQQIGVLIHCQSEPVKVSGRADQLEQVLMILLVNAKDALIAHRVGRIGFVAKIEIHTLTDADRVLICVQDNAGGIEPTLIERMFDPFFATQEMGRRTGLDLSASYSMIEHMGGRLSVSNQGAGARFCIELPRWQKNTGPADVESWPKMQ